MGRKKRVTEEQVIEQLEQVLELTDISDDECLDIDEILKESDEILSADKFESNGEILDDNQEVDISIDTEVDNEEKRVKNDNINIKSDNTVIKTDDIRVEVNTIISDVKKIGNEQMIDTVNQYAEIYLNNKLLHHIKFFEFCVKFKYFIESRNIVNINERDVVKFIRVEPSYNFNEILKEMNMI